MKPHYGMFILLTDKFNNNNEGENYNRLNQIKLVDRLYPKE